MFLSAWGKSFFINILLTCSNSCFEQYNILSFHQPTFNFFLRVSCLVCVLDDKCQELLSLFSKENVIYFHVLRAFIAGCSLLTRPVPKKDIPLAQDLSVYV
uniref:Uncharacterized protein n=1 Tax=Cacopsylla melanoneura TaxID=428564 RepID=A0A8D8ZD46_9HEMI